VPPDDPESNYGAAAGLLFNHDAARAATLHRMHADGMDLDAAALDYEVELRNTLGDPPRLDLVLIGVGPDGHVCSLFPGHPAEDERQRWVVAVRDAPKPPPRRLTMTLPVLETARCLCLGVFGRDKAAMVREILEEPVSPLPAARVLRGSADVLCLLDDEAASRLSRA
jgi:6-phosphogluconolactonase